MLYLEGPIVTVKRLGLCLPKTLMVKLNGPAGDRLESFLGAKLTFLRMEMVPWFSKEKVDEFARASDLKPAETETWEQTFRRS